MLPRRALCAAGEIVLDDGFLRPEYLAGYAAAIGVCRIDRIACLGDELQILPGGGDRLHPVRIRLAEQHDGRQRLAAIDRGVAHELV